MTKPTLCDCDQHGSRPACTSEQSDQDQCCSLSVSIFVIEFVSEQHGRKTHYVGFVMTRLIYLLFDVAMYQKLVCKLTLFLPELSFFIVQKSPENKFNLNLIIT
jgi:hypothetical protein